MCDKCDFASEENINHIVMQCPAYEQDRKAMYCAIHALPDGFGTRFARIKC